MKTLTSLQSKEIARTTINTEMKRGSSKQFKWNGLVYITGEIKPFLLDQSWDEMYKQWSPLSLAIS